MSAPAAGAAAGGSGLLATTASVVRNSPAMEAAFCRAERVTLTGSVTPAASRSSYSLVAAFRPWPSGRVKGKKTANTISSTYAELAEQYGATVTGVDDLNQTFELLLSGRIDATLNAEMTFYDYTKEHPDANVKIAVLTDNANQIAIPMRKGDETATLRTAIDAAIDELRADGTLKALSEKYFGRDISTEE